MQSDIESGHERPGRLGAMLSRVTLASVLCFAWAAGPVQAATVSLIWSGTTGAGVTGSDAIGAAVGDILTLDIILGADAAGVSSYGLSVLFDEDGANELDLAAPGATELAPPGFFNLTPGVGGEVESPLGDRGEVLTFEAATFGAGLVSASALIGQIAFLVTPHVVSDGFDLRIGPFDLVLDGLFDSASNDIGPTSTFGQASVNVVPLPAPIALMMFGLASLGLAVRRRGAGPA